MARRKKARRVHHRRRRMGSPGNDMMELFLGAMAGGVVGQLFISDQKIMGTQSPQTKAMMLGGGAYFLPKFIHGPMGQGAALGMAAIAGMNVAVSSGIIKLTPVALPPAVSGMGATYAGRALPVVGKPAPYQLGRVGGGLPVVGGVRYGDLGKAGATYAGY